MTDFTYEPAPWTDNNAPMKAATPEEQLAAAARAEDVLTDMGIGALPTGDAEFVLPRPQEVAALSPAHDLDATKDPYDLAPGPIAPNTRNMDMRKPVTAEEAKQKATVLADNGGPDGKLQPQHRDTFIAQWTEHLVGMNRPEFEQWKQDN